MTNRIFPGERTNAPLKNVKRIIKQNIRFWLNYTKYLNSTSTKRFFFKSIQNIFMELFINPIRYLFFKKKKIFTTEKDERAAQNFVKGLWCFTNRKSPFESGSRRGNEYLIENVEL